MGRAGVGLTSSGLGHGGAGCAFTTGAVNADKYQVVVLLESGFSRMELYEQPPVVVGERYKANIQNPEECKQCNDQQFDSYYFHVELQEDRKRVLSEYKNAYEGVAKDH